MNWRSGAGTSSSASSRKLLPVEQPEHAEASDQQARAAPVEHELPDVERLRVERTAQLTAGGRVEEADGAVLVPDDEDPAVGPHRHVVEAPVADAADGDGGGAAHQRRQQVAAGLDRVLQRDTLAREQQRPVEVAARPTPARRAAARPRRAPRGAPDRAGRRTARRHRPPSPAARARRPGASAAAGSCAGRDSPRPRSDHARRRRTLARRRSGRPRARRPSRASTPGAPRGRAHPGRGRAACHSRAAVAS